MSKGSTATISKLKPSSQDIPPLPNKGKNEAHSRQLTLTTLPFEFGRVSSSKPKKLHRLHNGTLFGLGLLFLDLLLTLLALLGFVVYAHEGTHSIVLLTAPDIQPVVKHPPKVFFVELRDSVEAL